MQKVHKTRQLQSGQPNHLCILYQYILDLKFIFTFFFPFVLCMNLLSFWPIKDYILGAASDCRLQPAAFSGVTSSHWALGQNIKLGPHVSEAILRPVIIVVTAQDNVVFVNPSRSEDFHNLVRQVGGISPARKSR